MPHNPNLKTVYSHLPIFEAVEACLVEEFDEEIQQLHLPYLYEVASGGDKNVKQIQGDEIWNKIQRTLVEIFPECWTAQELLVQGLVAVNVRRIYREELDFVIDRLIEENDWSKFKIMCNIILIICPRRFGKTAATAAVVATLLICVPGFEHVHFSLTLELAGVFMEDVKTLIMKSWEGKAMMCKLKQVKGKIRLQGDYPEDIRKSKCLAADSNVHFLFFLSIYIIIIIIIIVNIIIIISYFILVCGGMGVCGCGWFFCGALLLLLSGRKIKVVLYFFQFIFY